MNVLRKLVLGLGGVTVIAASGATIAFASTGSGFTSTILAHRATLSDSVKVNDDRVKLQTKGPTDVQVQTITYTPRGFSGWHFHPGLVIVVVESGHVTAHYSDCHTRTYGPHETFVESGTAPSWPAMRAIRRMQSCMRLLSRRQEVRSGSRPIRR